MKGTGAVGDLANTGKQTASAIRQGNVGGAAKGLASGTGKTVAGAGKGVDKTVSGLGDGVSSTVSSLMVFSQRQMLTVQ